MEVITEPYVCCTFLGSFTFNPRISFLNILLKLSRLGAPLICSGILFQTVGPWNINDAWAVLVLVLGIWYVCSSVCLVFLSVSWLWSVSLSRRFEGASSLLHLYIRTDSKKSLLSINVLHPRLGTSYRDIHANSGRDMKLPVYQLPI